MPRTRNEAAHRATRTRILEAAQGLFARQGFQGTGMAAICEAVGMSPGTLYRYFPSKDAIIEAFVEEELAESLASLEPLLEAKNVVAVLVDLIDEAVVAASDPEYIAVATEVVAEAHRNSTVGAHVATLQQTVFRTLAAALERARGTGAIDAEVDVEAAAATFLALIDGATTLGASIGELGAPRRRAFLDRLVRRTLGA
ncbi:MAG: TetR/AcrR family transcriptional regulator [Myxococcota bacterium]